MNIDVAINSYRKPESLIYTLLSLKQSDQHQLIDTIYINDDCSNDGTTACYQAPLFIEAMQPIQLKLRTNRKNTGYGRKIVTPEIFLSQLNNFRLSRINYKQIRRHGFYVSNDVRYQWAINSTDKDYLLIIHDDILFKQDVCKLYLDSLRTLRRGAIVGDLGQCWICREKELADCTPDKVNRGVYPNSYFPLTRSEQGSLPLAFERRCRINEWCCMLKVEVARQTKPHYFGNYEEKGDVGAYWFSEIMRRGYRFCEPLPTQAQRDAYYHHGWQGHTGHAVWLSKENMHQDIYDRAFIRQRLESDFGYKLAVH